MSRKWTAIIFGILSLLLISSVALASGGNCKKEAQKVGILLVAFGSSEASAQVSFVNIDRSVKAAYPGVEVRWAYTSHIIRKKLAKQGKKLDSPRTALAKMADDGFTQVVVQSLHTIPGQEYDDLRKTVRGFKLGGAFGRIIVGYPMLATHKDFERTAAAIIKAIPKQRKKDEGVVLMGHGTHHPANAFYAALMFQLQLTDPNILIGTVEGYPELTDIVKWLKKRNIKKVYLMPFMSVAGDHAKNDMASDEDDSWKTAFEKAGIKTVAILKGTAEYQSFVDIWVSHIKGPLSHFTKHK